MCGYADVQIKCQGKSSAHSHICIFAHLLFSQSFSDLIRSSLQLFMSKTQFWP